MELEKYNEKIFDEIKHIDKEGNEYWHARELQKILKYKQWRRFESIVKDSIITCKANNYNVLDHFAGVGKMVSIGSGAKRKVVDYKLSRYACYLIVMNGDPRKEVIALGQTYFAFQTRKMELLEDSLLTEEGKRLHRRELTKKGNKELDIKNVKN